MPRRLFRLIPLLVPAVLCSVRPAAAQTAPPARTHTIELDDYFTLDVITGPQASPDGRYVAYTQTRWDQTLDRRNADLWLIEVATQARRRLTFDPAADGSPTWSPDGHYLYFSSAPKRAGETSPPYNGQSQVWRIRPEAGEPTPVTRVADGVTQLALSRDGRTLYYLVSKEKTDDDFKALRTKQKHLEYGHGVTKFSQLWKLDLESWRGEKLIDDQRVIHGYAVAPDGRRIALITTPDGLPLSHEGWSRVELWNAATKKSSVITTDEWRKDHPSPFGWVDNLAWSADGLALAFSTGFDGYPGELFVAEGPDDAMPVRQLSRPDEIDCDGGLRWRGETRELCFVGECRARKWVCGLQNVRDGGTGEFRKLSDGDVVVSTYSFDQAGDDLFMVLDTLTRPTELYHLSAGTALNAPVRLTNVNPQVDTWKLPQIQIVGWSAPDGTPVEGILELPPDYQPGPDAPRLPTILELHGGPTGASPFCLQFWIYGRTTMPAKGYALLSPNYRGSTGYGRKFLTGLIGRENDIEVKDILAGVDALVQRGIADPQRLGVMGWSNGGFLTNCMITQTDRFKAASSGAGVLDMVIQWGSEDTPGHVINFMRGLPWETPEAYRQASPVFDLAKVKTPTLIHVGASDPRCPPAHSRGLYRALRHYLKVPTELVIYPNEGHSLTTYKNRQAKMEWDVAWFDRYLSGKKGEAQATSTPSATKDSPEVD